MSAVSQLRATTRAIVTHPANHRRRGRALLRFVGFQLWERVARRPLPVRFEGLTLLCFPHQFASSAVVYNRLPDWEEMHFVRGFLKPGDLFVDVGANVGVYTLLGASIDGVAVDAFEPSTFTHSLLEANVARNSLQSRVTTRRCAVGSTPGEATLTTQLGTMNRIDDSDAHGETVPVVTLDDAITRPPALVKIDVEGFELDVLRGAETLIAAHAPALLVEVNDRAALREWFVRHDYEAFRYDVAAQELRPCAVGDTANVIGIRRVASAP